jgi:hypothetical protein
MRWAGHVARMGAKKNAYRLLVRKPEGKRPIGRPRCRWVDDIRMALGEVGTRGSVVVKALCYKQEGRGFDTR